MVYGTVIAYANEPCFDNGTLARKWEAHRAEVDRQGQDWVRLRGHCPEIPLVVIGDLNQIRDGSNLYAGRADQARLTAALEAAGLRCLSDDRNLGRGLAPDRYLVDHVCTTADLRSTRFSCREPLDGGSVLSDHPVLWVDL